MSEESLDMEELGEEVPPPLPAIPGEREEPEPIPYQEPVIREKALTFSEASRGLNTLGKDESGARYAYLRITATNKALTDVSVILQFKHVLFLDLSYNYLTLESLEVLTAMPFLIFLKAPYNRVESAGLSPVPYLQVLILSNNYICDTANISQPVLESLELSNNKIYNVAFDHLNLKELKILDLHGNMLVDLSGTFPTSLERLFLASNSIKTINAPDLIQLRNLKILHLRNNKIRKLDGFTEHLESLEYLNLRGNAINKFRQFRKLQCLPKLETLVILDNPVSSVPQKPQRGEDAGEEDEEPEVLGEDEEIQDKCVIPLLVLLPDLKRINKHTVIFDDKLFVNGIRPDKTAEIMSELSSEDEDETATAYTERTDLGEEEEDDEDDEDEFD